MVTQTRLTTRRSMRLLRATIGAYMIVACCGLILLSAVSTYASVMSASPASTAPQIERLTAARPRQIELADPSLAATAVKRKQLTYLVRCAMPADVELYAQQGSECFTFPGSIGLAPHWLTQAMTPSEERWVSACLLAHVNFFGKHVRISIRANDPPVPELEASNDERKTYTIAEGGFFGNLVSRIESRDRNSDSDIG